MRDAIAVRRRGPRRRRTGGRRLASGGSRAARRLLRRRRRRRRRRLRRRGRVRRRRRRAAEAAAARRSRCSRPRRSHAGVGFSKPRSVRSPAGWVIASASVAAKTRRLIRIWPGAAVSHRRSASVGTVPTGAYSQRRSKPMRPIVAWPSASAGGELEVEAEPVPALGELPHAVAQRDREPDRARRRIWARQRVVEHDHQLVAGQPHQRPLGVVDQLAERRVVGVEHRHHVLGLGALGEAPRTRAARRPRPRSRAGGRPGPTGRP